MFYGVRHGLRSIALHIGEERLPGPDCTLNASAESDEGGGSVHYPTPDPVFVDMLAAYRGSVLSLA